MSESSENGMGCERVDLLLGLLENALDAHEREAVEGHLEGCAVCRETVEAYRSTADALSELPEERPSEEARGRAYAAVMELMAQEAATATADSAPTEAAPAAAPQPTSGGGKRGLVIPFVQFLAAAACVALAVSFLLGPGAGDPSALTAKRTLEDEGSSPAPAAAADSVSEEAESGLAAELAKPADAPTAAPAAPGEKATGASEYEDTEAEFVRRIAQETQAGRARKAKARDLGLAEKESRREAELEKLKAKNEAEAKAEARASAVELKKDSGRRAKQEEGMAEFAEGARAPRRQAPADADPLAEDEADDALADADAPAEADDEAFDGDTGPAGGKVQAPPAPPAAKAAGRVGGGPQAAWQLNSPSGSRVYVLLADAGLVYRDVPVLKAGDGAAAGEAAKKGAKPYSFASSAGRVQVSPTAVPAAARQGTRAKPDLDFRVAEELLAIVSSELRLSEADGFTSARTARRQAGVGESARQRAVAVLRVLGERLPADEDLPTLRRRVQLLRTDHLRSMKRMRSAEPALELDEAKGR